MCINQFTGHICDPPLTGRASRPPNPVARPATTGARINVAAYEGCPGSRFFGLQRGYGYGEYVSTAAETNAARSLPESPNGRLPDTLSELRPRNALQEGWEANGPDDSSRLT